MFRMKYTHNDMVIKTSQIKTINVPLQDPVFNMKAKGGASITIGNMFERVRSGNDNCGNCGGFKHGV